MGWFDWIGRLLGGKAATGGGHAASAAPAPPAPPAATSEDWQTLCTAVGEALDLEDVDELWGEVHQALTQPQQYYNRFADDLPNRGIDAPEDVTPWLALVDGLQRRGQNFELDWKLDMGDAIWALRALKTVQQRAVPLEPLAASKALSHDALLEAGDYLRTRGLSLVSFDIESDSYPLSVLETGAVAPLQALAKRVGSKVVDLAN